MMMMIMMSTLYYTNTLSWILIVKHTWNNSPRLDMSLHLNTLSWFVLNQSWLLLVNAVHLAEKQQIPILQSLVLSIGAWTHALPHFRRAW